MTQWLNLNCHYHHLKTQQPNGKSVCSFTAYVYWNPLMRRFSSQNNQGCTLPSHCHVDTWKLNSKGVCSCMVHSLTCSKKLFPDYKSQFIYTYLYYNHFYTCIESWFHSGGFHWILVDSGGLWTFLQEKVGHCKVLFLLAASHFRPVIIIGIFIGYFSF